MKDERDDKFSNAEDEALAAKHKRIRGTNALKYPINNGSRCEQLCCLLDLRDDGATNPSQRLRHHRCFLFTSHEGSAEGLHEFSSECARSRFAPAGEVEKIDAAA